MSHTIRKGECRVPGCEGKHRSKGYCNPHYHQWRRQGCPKYEDFKPFVRYTGCCVPGCTGIHNAKGFCRIHYLFWLDLGRPTNWPPPS
ncbi:MAG: Response regulator receiver protein [Candidatus Uhrbacteria bacterium GW2011_GWF2_40_263]|nr:MAG: Response regulator receiver protein [Candidatus Uhrbacteria bacterium GW2011_GWF2_40_263]